MKNLYLLILAVLIFGTNVSVHAQEALDSLIDDKGQIFEIKADSFITGDRKPFFKWNSKKQDVARAPGYSNTPDMKFWDIKIWECLVDFKEAKLSSITLLFYNRGDAGTISEESFKTLKDKIISKFDEWTGEKAVKLKVQKINREKLYSRAWVKGPYSVLMSYTYTGKRNDFRAEFIKVVISKFSKDNDPRIPKKSLGKKLPKVINKAGLLANIKKNDDEDVFIEGIPMVDQGAKGYCVVATSERVLKYYGIKIDQNRLAQLCDSSGEGGTSRKAMIEAMKKAGVKLRIKVKELEKNKSYDTFSDFKKFVKKYNTFAKKAKVPKYNPNRALIGTDYYPMAFFESVDYEVLKKFKTEGDKRGFKDFKKDIKKTVDTGIPVIWTLMTGLYKEKDIPQQQIGGHMRLIIGYNDKEGKVIYSDSWGAGHEFKKMTYEDAWTITTGTSYFTPRSNR